MTTTTPAPKELRRDLRQVGTLLIAAGVLGTIAGILAIAYPDITLLALALIAGINLMLLGVMSLVDAFSGDGDTTTRVLAAVLGLLGIIGGLVVIRRPGESLLAIVIVAGIFLVAEGVIRIVRAFASTGARWWGVAIGAVDVICGIVILAWPGIGLVTLAVFFAVTMLIRGVFAIVVGLRLRSVRNAPEESSPHTATSAA
jgi:uncharacterized membrane protein HdeD (DUF308 family)